MNCKKIDGKYHFSDGAIAHTISIVKTVCTCEEFKKNKRNEYELPFNCKHIFHKYKSAAFCIECRKSFINESKYYRAYCDKCDAEHLRADLLLWGKKQ
jgi:hypothetical protein